MNWEAISAVGEIIGALAVVVTLFYLSTQIRQSRRQEEIQSFQAAIERFLKNLDQATGTTQDADIFRRGLNEYESLSPGEQGVFHSKMHSLLHGLHTVWKLFKSGTLPEYELVAMRSAFIELLLTPGGQQWWSAFKHIPPPHYVVYLDEELRKAEGNIAPANLAYHWLRSDLDVPENKNDA
jgi:hypothetical protein